MKKGFSMAEVLMAIVIIGVIAALTIPVITQTTTSSLKTLYKSAYTNVETVVNELINDISLYPSGEFTNNTFCANFFSKVNTIGYSSSNCANTFSSSVPGTPNAKTTNGMRWYRVEDDFVNCASTYSLDAGNCIKVSIDVDGSGKGTNTSGQDILDLYIYTTGKITVPSGSTEDTYLTE